MNNTSIWKNGRYKKYRKLDKDELTDILIIGGGITGISTFYHLRNSGYKLMLVEQNKIGFGSTSNSTGKLSYLQNDLIDKIRKSSGDEKASLYLKSQIDAINRIVKTIKKEKISCDLKKVNSKLYTVNKIKKVKNLQRFLEGNDIVTKQSQSKLVAYNYMIEAYNTYIFHPLKFIYGLLNTLKYPIYENTSIKKILKKDGYYLCYTDKYMIRAKYVVIASFYPYFILPFLFPIKAILEKSYLSASLYNKGSESLISYSKPFISLRTHKNMIIYLSNSHNINTDIDDVKHFKSHFKKIKQLGLTPSYIWSNIDIMTNDGLPYIGKINNNMYIATGYNTWGLTSGFLAGTIISDMILNVENRYVDLFNPKRINAYQIMGIFKCSYNSLQGIVNGFLNKDDDVIKRNINGEKVLIYKNHIVNYKCPHFGCPLVFNKIEKIWECPCHGSRFEINGNPINGPANHKI